MIECLPLRLIHHVLDVEGAGTLELLFWIVDSRGIRLSLFLIIREVQQLVGVKIARAVAILLKGKVSATWQNMILLGNFHIVKVMPIIIFKLKVVKHLLRLVLQNVVVHSS